MEYAIASNEIRQFYKKLYVQNRTDKDFVNTADEINTDVFKMSINEWGTKHLKAHLIQIKAQKEAQIIGGASGEFIVLHFVCEGKTAIGDKQVYPSIISQNTNNVFCSTESNIRHLFEKGENNRYFKIFLPYSYISVKAEQYPEVFGALLTMIKNRCPVLKEGSLITTFEMETVIEQIMHASDMGVLAPLYFETKIQELLILQLQQMKKINCPECKYYKHYQEQLNEARNLLEIRYQTPLTITKLAQEVGMSETVLKTNFKNCFGTTIYGYLFDYRMNMAKRLLSDSNLTITEIGDQTGYEYPSHFTTAFKRKFGISPAEYRRRKL